MTPYARKFFQFLTIPFVMGFVGQVLSLYFRFELPLEVVWGGVAALVVASSAVIYFKAIGDLRDVTGVYVQAARLGKAGSGMFGDLGVSQYRPCYLKRGVDEIIRARLRGAKGVVVTGRPLAGKTRAALEAIMDTLPDAWIMRINPVEVGSDELMKLVVPCPFIFFGKPVVVVFIDDIDGGLAENVERILARLTVQTAALYVVSTCVEGVPAAKLEALKRSGHGHMFDSVPLADLTAQESATLMFETWKNRGQPILGDITLPGYIVLGTNPVANKIKALSSQGRRLVQALRIAAASGDMACRATLYWSIAKDVLGVVPDKANRELLADLERNDILVVSGTPLRVSIRHASYLDESYSEVAVFKDDLKRYANWLYATKDTRRLAAVSAHYAGVVLDSEQARLTMAQVIALGTRDPLHYVTLAGLHAGAGSKVDESQALDSALALASTPGEKARLLIAHGDALLYRLFRPAESMDAYNRAYYLVEKEADEPTIDLVRRRSGDNLLVVRDYVRAEPYFASWRNNAKDDDLLDACERLALCQLGQGKTEEAREVLRDAWSSLKPDARVARAVQLMDDAEGCLEPDKADLADQLAFDVVRGGVKTGTVASDTARELVDLALSAYRQGLVHGSEIVNGFLCTLREPVLDRPNQVAALINFGVAQNELGKFEASRQSFERVRKMTAPGSGLELYAAAADTGAGDLAMLEASPDKAKPLYQRALTGAEMVKDTNLSNWARLGLAEVAVAQKNFEDADLILKKISYISPSYREYMRHWLAQARIRIHFEQWDDARSYVDRAFALKRRRNLAAIQAEFVSLSEWLKARQSSHDNAEQDRS